MSRRKGRRACHFINLLCFVCLSIGTPRTVVRTRCITIYYVYIIYARISEGCGGVEYVKPGIVVAELEETKTRNDVSF